MQWIARAVALSPFTFDGHGSTRVLTDLADAVAELNGVDQIFHYDAYGNAIGFAMADAATEFLYSGEQFDAKIGQQYLRQRYYDPKQSGSPIEPNA